MSSRFKLLIYFVISIIYLSEANAQISDKRLCVDVKCSVPASLAKSLVRYSSPDSRILSFASNVDLTIYSKSAGSNMDLWGAEVNGKRGYVPRHLIRETKVLTKPTILVDTEANNESETTVTTQQVPYEPVAPNAVQEPYEVVDGTTILLNPDEIHPSSTESTPVVPTAIPTGSDLPEVVSKEQVPTENLVEDVKKEEEVKKEEDGGDILSTLSNFLSNGGDGEEDEDDEDFEDDEEDEVTVEDEAKEAENEATNLKSDDNLILQTENVKVDEAAASESVENSANVVNEEKVETESLIAESAEIKPEVPTDQIELNDTVLSAEVHQLEEANVEIEVPQNVSGDADKQPEIAEVVESLPPAQKQIEEDSIPVFNTTENPIDLPSEEVLEPIEITTTASITENEAIPLETETITENPLAIEVPAASSQPPPPPPLDNNWFSQHKQDIQQENVVTAEETKSGEEVVVEKVEESVVSTEDIQTTAFEGIGSVEEVIRTPINEEVQEKSENQQVSEEEGSKSAEVEDSNGWFFGMIGGKVEEKEEVKEYTVDEGQFEENGNDHLLSKLIQDSSALPQSTTTTCDGINNQNLMDALFTFNPDIFIYLLTTAISVLIFLFGYIAFDKNKREGPLIAKINQLEKELLIQLKENENLQNKRIEDGDEQAASNNVSMEIVDELKSELSEMTQAKCALEEQIQMLEKELENSTEVGMELNRMLSEVLSSDSNGSDGLKANVENLQRQLVEQQSTINSINETLALTNTENHELTLHLEISNKKVVDLQFEMDKLLQNLLNIEEEKDQQQQKLESEIELLKTKYQELSNEFMLKQEESDVTLKKMTKELNEARKNLELKRKEYEALKSTMSDLKNNKQTVEKILESSEIRAELEVLQNENEKLQKQCENEEVNRTNLEKKMSTTLTDYQQLKAKYDEVDKLRMESETKLEVLSNYFKDKEAQLQKEISKHESLWVEKQGEASSTTERIKFMQEQLQNYKDQTESLKQEIMNQEVALKSQISMLEKKVHENWVMYRQAERKLDDAKQEAAQLRNRLTLRERESQQQRLLTSPLIDQQVQNGDQSLSAISPNLMESSSSPPPLLFNRDHITKSPPLPPFMPPLPPPPGVPFMPPLPHGVVPPFMPPLPPPGVKMYPGDHRPPPLGRMSSPVNRYSPSSRGYSPYDERNSSSASESEYYGGDGGSYSSYNNSRDRDYKRGGQMMRNSGGGGVRKGNGVNSSASGNSNESLERINNNSRHSNKV